LGGASERRRLERDLHDGVQSELVAVIVKVAVAQQHPETPPALAQMLAAIEGQAQAALDSVRNIARGIYPPVLADLGLGEALRAQAARAAVSTRLVGTAPRAAEEAEEAVYFACSEAIQNVVKHAGEAARVVLRLIYHQGSLVVRISDDGQGFDPEQATDGVGLQSIRDRVEDLGGTVELASKPGCGTVLTVALPWPTTAERGQ
jgi:signal transduction histidine kinase